MIIQYMRQGPRMLPPASEVPGNRKSSPTQHPPPDSQPHKTSRRSGRGTGSHNEPASSGNSTASDVTSASVLCSSPQFQTWATKVRLNSKVNSSIPSHPTFQPLRDLKNLSNGFPTWLTDANLLQPQLIFEALHADTTELRDELIRRQNDPKESINLHLHNDIKLHLFSLQIILNACHHMRLLGTHTRKPTEADRRHSLDTLLAHICEMDNDNAGVSAKYSTDQELKLPLVSLENCNVIKVKADDVMYLDVPNFAPYHHGEMQIPAKAFCQKGLPDILQVIHCVAKFKREEDGSHQGMTAMVSGLYQRAVLQMPGQFVFGVFHSQMVIFKVVAGIWQDGKIQLYEIGSYSLTIPIHALQLYFVLRGIHRLAGSYDRELRSAANALLAQVMNNPPLPEWHPPRMGSIDEDLNEDQQPPHQGGTNTQQETRGQRRARHKVQSYLENTRSERLYYGVMVMKLITRFVTQFLVGIFAG
ncbi:hypothetical protein RSOLAG22IIIB_06406 [Rhizoctonia solani]|uniref:Uncharacterized protein n=1 Tax=Rhizoctonia solani TaxID=456999 RepID=A0A0K6GED5_9AGAM|nr:hypothetical protein RSOLAG22IIIB_06406 [Rhizoctonia solani]